MQIAWIQKYRLDRNAMFRTKFLPEYLKQGAFFWTWVANKVIAHPTRAIGSTGSLAASTNRTVSRTEAPLALAVLATERKAA